MKKTFLILLILLFTLSSYSQIASLTANGSTRSIKKVELSREMNENSDGRKGTTYIGGGLGLQFNYGGAISVGFSVAPEIGRYVSDHFAIGLTAGYSLTYVGYDSYYVPDVISHTVIVMPTMEGYSPISEGPVAWAPQLGVGYCFNDELGHGLALGVSLLKFNVEVTPHFDLYFDLCGASFLFMDIIDYPSYSLGLNLGTTSSVGLRYCF